MSMSFTLAKQCLISSRLERCLVHAKNDTGFVTPFRDDWNSVLKLMFLLLTGVRIYQYTRQPHILKGFEPELDKTLVLVSLQE